MINYTIKSRPKIPRNKYGYLASSSTGGGGATVTQISTSDGGNTINYYGEQILETATYTDVINTSSTNSQAKAKELFLKIRPKDYLSTSIVHFRLYTSPSSGDTNTYKNYMKGYYDVKLWFYGSSRVFDCFMSFPSSSYRPIYYINTYNIKDETTYNNNTDLGHYIGISLVNAYASTTSTIKRDYKVELLEVENADYEILKDDDGNYALKTVSDLGISTTTHNSVSNITMTNQGNYHSTDYNDTAWKIPDFSIHTNNDTYSLRSYQIIGFGADGKVQGLTNSAASYTSSGTKYDHKIPSPLGFNPNRPLEYYTQYGTINPSTNIGQCLCWFYYHSVDLRYNIQYTTPITTNQQLYLKMKLHSDGLLYFDQPTETNPYPVYHSYTLPTTDDGYYYWYVGENYSASSYYVVLSPYQPIFKYDKTKKKAVIVQINPTIVGNIKTEGITATNIDVDNLTVNDTTTYGELITDNLEVHNLVVDTTTTISGKVYVNKEATIDDNSNVFIYGTPNICHKNADGTWTPHVVLDGSDVCEEITDTNDNYMPKVKAVKKYVQDNATFPIDCTALATEGGTITSSELKLIKQPLWLTYNGNYCSARYMPKNGDNDTAWLMWDICITSMGHPKITRHYAMQLTGENSGAIPVQTDGIIEAYNLYYYDETITWNNA